MKLKLYFLNAYWRTKYFLKFIRCEVTSDRIEIERQYLRYFGELPNLKEPTGFNEKIQWLKLNDRTNLHTVCADKVNVRQYVKEKLGSENNLVPLLRVYDSPFDLDIDDLPEEPFIIKSSHYCGDYEICRDKTKLDLENLIERYIKTTNCNIYHNGREWQYKGVQRRIIVEKLLMDSDGAIPSDLKIHCFEGKPEFIYVASGREGDNYRNVYDSSWNKLDFTWARKGKDLSKFNKYDVNKPHNLGKALSIAEKLSAEFRYLRVDLYLVGDDIFVGELTFHQGSGFDEILPKSWDLKLGSLIEIDSKT